MSSLLSFFYQMKESSFSDQRALRCVVAKGFDFSVCDWLLATGADLLLFFPTARASSLGSSRRVARYSSAHPHLVPFSFQAHAPKSCSSIGECWERRRGRGILGRTEKKISRVPRNEFKCFSLPHHRLVELQKREKKLTSENRRSRVRHDDSPLN